MDGQSGLMEYIFMIVFLAIVIIVFIFFLTGYQVTQFTSQQAQSSIDRSFSLMNFLSTSPLLVKEEGVFDDGKLTALASLENPCSLLEDRFGKNWFFTITILDGTESNTACSGPLATCNAWSFCERDAPFVAFDIPTNVYRVTKTPLASDFLPGNDLALLTVGVYE